jgi:hypothetical protein
VLVFCLVNCWMRFLASVFLPKPYSWIFRYSSLQNLIGPWQWLLWDRCADPVPTVQLLYILESKWAVLGLGDGQVETLWTWAGIELAILYTVPASSESLCLWHGVGVLQQA